MAQRKDLELLHGEIRKIISNVTTSGSNSVMNPSGILSSRHDGFRLGGSKSSLRTFEEKIGVLAHLNDVAKSNVPKKAGEYKRLAKRILIPFDIRRDMEGRNQKAHLNANSLVGSHDFLAISSMYGHSFAVSEFYPGIHEVAQDPLASASFGIDVEALIDPNSKVSMAAKINGTGFMTRAARRIQMMKRPLERANPNSEIPFDVSLMTRKLTSPFSGVISNITAIDERKTFEEEDEIPEERKEPYVAEDYVKGRMGNDNSTSKIHYPMMGDEEDDSDGEYCFVPNGALFEEGKRRDKTEEDGKDFEDQHGEKQEQEKKRLEFLNSPGFPTPITLSLMSAFNHVDIFKKMFTYLDREVSMRAVQRKMFKGVPASDDIFVGKDLMKNPAIQLVFFLKNSSYGYPLENWDGSNIMLMKIVEAASKAMVGRVWKTIGDPIVRAWVSSAFPDLEDVEPEASEEVRMSNFLMANFFEKLEAHQNKTMDHLLNEVSDRERVDRGKLESFTKNCLAIRDQANRQMISILRSFLEMHQEILKEGKEPCSEEEVEFMKMKRRNKDLLAIGKIVWKGIEDPCWLQNFSSSKIAPEFDDLYYSLEGDHLNGYTEDSKELKGMYRRAMLSLTEELRKVIALGNSSIIPEIFDIVKKMDPKFEGENPREMDPSETLMKIGLCLKNIRYKVREHRQTYKELLQFLKGKFASDLVEDTIPILRKTIGGMVFMKELSEVIYVKKHQLQIPEGGGEGRSVEEKGSGPAKRPFRHLPQVFHQECRMEFGSKTFKMWLVEQAKTFDEQLSSWLNGLMEEYFNICILSLNHCQSAVTGAKIIQMLGGSSLSEARISTGVAGIEKQTKETLLKLGQVLRVPFPAPPFDPVWKVLDAMKGFSDKVRSGEWKGFTGKALSDVVCIGIGGSYLGVEFVYEALKTDPEAAAAASGRKLRFLANVDPIDVQRALEGLNPETTLVVIISKTFTTAETMLNAKTVKAWLVKAMGEDCVAKHVVACSTALDKTKAFGIDSNNVFGFWDWVGGRFSVWSAVGVLALSLQQGDSAGRCAELQHEAWATKNAYIWQY
eukprot:s3240_g1.t1